MSSQQDVDCPTDASSGTICRRSRWSLLGTLLVDRRRTCAVSVLLQAALTGLRRGGRGAAGTWAVSHTMSGMKGLRPTWGLLLVDNEENTAVQAPRRGRGPGRVGAHRCSRGLDPLVQHRLTLSAGAEGKTRSRDTRPPPRSASECLVHLHLHPRRLVGRRCGGRGRCSNPSPFPCHPCRRGTTPTFSHCPSCVAMAAAAAFNRANTAASRIQSSLPSYVPRKCSVTRRGFAAAHPFPQHLLISAGNPASAARFCPLTLLKRLCCIFGMDVTCGNGTIVKRRPLRFSPTHGRRQRTLLFVCTRLRKKEGEKSVLDDAVGGAATIRATRFHRIRTISETAV